MKSRYEFFNDLVMDLGDAAMEAISLNAASYSVSTVSGSHVAFRERCSVLLSEVDLADLLRLLSQVECGHWQMPEHAGSLARAVRFAVIDHVDTFFNDERIDYCFEWATGSFLSTLEQCAEASRKVVSVRRSRDIRSAGEGIDRFLMRVRHAGGIPDPAGLHDMLVAKSMMFRPVVNDQRADWTALGRLGIDRPRLFELMSKVANYGSLCNENQTRFLALANDEIGSYSRRADA